MIYFTEIKNDKTGGGTVGEEIVWQFFLKELPESITFPHQTKLAKIEYNGGFITNQIIGIYNREIEWSGTFFGTYIDEKGSRYSAKVRSDNLKKFMGRPIRVGFEMPGQGDAYVPGESPMDNTELGKISQGKGGDVGVYIIEEYDITIVNHSDVDYRIKLAPHIRQEKIKPTSLEVIPIKLNIEAVKQAGQRVRSAAPKATTKPPFAKAVQKGQNAVKLADAPNKNGRKLTLDGQVTQQTADKFRTSKPSPPTPAVKSKK
jgi:hypothetical protein